MLIITCNICKKTVPLSRGKYSNMFHGVCDCAKTNVKVVLITDNPHAEVVLDGEGADEV